MTPPPTPPVVYSKPAVADPRPDRGDWLQSADGRQVYPLDPHPEDFASIEVFAFVLARTNRFNGHAGYYLPHDWHPYNVAHHAVLVSYACDRGDEFDGLMHEPDEIYLPDVPRPIKYGPAMRWWRGLCDRHHDAAAESLGFSRKLPPSVKRADLVLLATEQRDLMGPPPAPWITMPPPLPERIVPWSAYEAECRFLDRYYELTGKARPQATPRHLSDAAMGLDAPCVTPTGRTDGHMAYVVARDGKMACAFCHRVDSLTPIPHPDDRPEGPGRC